MASNDERTSACGNTDPHGQHTWPNGGDTSRLCLGSHEASNDDVRVSGIPLNRTYGNEALGVFEFLTIHNGTPTHVAHSLAPEAQAKRREAVEKTLWRCANLGQSHRETQEAVLKTLGLSDA